MRRPLILVLLGTWLLAACQSWFPGPAPEATPTGVAAVNPVASQTSAAGVGPAATAAAASPTITPSPTVTLTPTPSPLPPTPTPFVYVRPRPLAGIHIDQLGNANQLSLVAGSGASWTRAAVFEWDKVEPLDTIPEAYNWSAIPEAQVEALLEAGLQPIAIVQFAPAWAQKYPGVACGPLSEAGRVGLAEFMGALAARYPRLTYWEIGNEPDVDRNYVDARSGFGCWGEEADPYYGGGEYAETLKFVYPSVKAANPSAQVLVGGLALDCDPVSPPESPPGSGTLRNCSAARFLEGILAAGAGDSFDGVSFHAYDFYWGSLGKYGNENWHSAWNTTGPSLSAKTRYLRALLASFGQPDKEILNTEVGLLCGSTGKEPECQTEEFQLTKAYFAVLANASARASLLETNIWFTLLGWRASGLVDRALQALPAYEALAFSAQQMEEAVFLGEVRDYDGVKGYAFANAENRFWLLWAQDESSHTIELPEQPAAVLDATGNQVAVGNPRAEISVGYEPLFVIWLP